MNIKATKPAPAEVICEDCDKVIEPDDRVSCFDCASNEVYFAEAEARADERRGHAPASIQIREWAKRRHLMGQISREVRAELELCADDIECGHG